MSIGVAASEIRCPRRRPRGLDPVDGLGHLLLVPLIEALGQAFQPGGGGGEILPLLGASGSSSPCWRTIRDSLLRPSLRAFSTICGSRTRPLPPFCWESH